MKRIILSTILALIMVPALCRAQVCSPGNTIDLTLLPQPLKLAKIQQEIKDYKSHPEGDHYEVCFQMNELEVSASTWTGPIAIKADPGPQPPLTAKDIYIVGIKLRNNELDPISNELFVAQNDITGKIILKDFQFKQVKKGIILQGKHLIEIKSSIVEGDDSGAGPCIEINAPKAMLDEVNLSKCKEGVLVQADGAIINKSTIIQNKIGVMIKTGVLGTDIISSLIYANDDGDGQTPLREDGVRIEGGAAHATAFYDIVDGEAVPVAEGEDVIQYGDRTPYILVPIPPGETEPAKMEFYLSKETECGVPVYSKRQACGIVEVEGSPLRIDIDSAALEQGPVSVELPPAQRAKDLVTMYSDPELGTAGISRGFTVAETADGIVTFVSTPYDIPTTGATDVDITTGVDETEDYEVEEGATSMGGEAEVIGGGAIEGTGGDIVSVGKAGGCGGGASLTRDSFRNIHIGLNLWWILLILALGIGANLVRVRVKKRK